MTIRITGVCLLAAATITWLLIQFPDHSGTPTVRPADNSADSSEDSAEDSAEGSVHAIPAVLHPELLSESPFYLVSAQPGFVGANRRQSFLWGEYLDPDHPRKFLLTDEINNASTNNQWQTSNNLYSASFDLIDACSMGLGTFYVLGSNYRNGVLTHIVEQWQATPQASVLGGGVAYDMVRDELYRDTVLGDLRLIEIDPEGRFLVVLSDWVNGTGDLTQLSLPGLVPTTLVSGLSGITELGKFQHATLGRVWIAHTPDVEWVTALFDSDNDGVFESHTTYQYDAWEQLNFWAGVVDNFVEM